MAASSPVSATHQSFQWQQQKKKKKKRSHPHCVYLSIMHRLEKAVDYRDGLRYLGMMKVPGNWKLSRNGCFKKSTNETLLSNPEKLLILSTKFNKHGEDIVQPQHRFEDIKSVISDGVTDEFKDVLNSIQEVLVLPLSLAFSLNPYHGVWEYIRVYNDPLDVEELNKPDYDTLRRELLKPKPRGVGVMFQYVKGQCVKKPPKALPPVTFTKRPKQ